MFRAASSVDLKGEQKKSQKSPRIAARFKHSFTRIDNRFNDSTTQSRPFAV